MPPTAPLTSKVFSLVAVTGLTVFLSLFNAGCDRVKAVADPPDPSCTYDVIWGGLFKDNEFVGKLHNAGGDGRCELTVKFYNENGSPALTRSNTYYLKRGEDKTVRFTLNQLDLAWSKYRVEVSIKPVL